MTGFSIQYMITEQTLLMKLVQKTTVKLVKLLFPSLTMNLQAQQ